VIWKATNAVGYQLVWLVSVASAANGSLYAGPLAATAFAVMVLAFGNQRRADLLLIPLVLAIGLLADSAWIAFGWLDYSAPWPSGHLAPGWILGIWMAFALTLNHSLAFLKRRYALAALLGGIGGPLAYWSASHGFGAVHFVAATSTVLCGLCVGWALIAPVLVRFAEQRSLPRAREAVP
jgi:hypothetical protein